ncbi:hypothetical protein AMK25_25040 [Micromonospora sp. TSRI0369]|nr:hypothetical protein AMK25_25040 [Micromonospora sp. TSRI0369]
MLMLVVVAPLSGSSDSGWFRWMPVASAVVAVFALLVALSNRNTSRRALALSLQQEERRAARLTVTLDDSASWRRRDAPRWVGMKILAVNPTDRDAAVVSADLHIAYTLQSGLAMTVKVRHETTGDAFPGEVDALDLPARLQANGAVAGWLTFRLPADLFPAGAGIHRYDAVLQDSRGIAATISASVLREVGHDQRADDQKTADETER